jgi:hypothetical protein
LALETAGSGRGVIDLRHPSHPGYRGPGTRIRRSRRPG